MQKKILISMFGAAALLVGCPADDDGPSAGESNAAMQTESGDGSGTAATEGGSMSGVDTASSGATDDPSEGATGNPNPTGIGFIDNPDGGTVSIECDIWGQDCPEGQKCNPWANDGGGAWNGTKCVPVDANPGQPGDACSVEGSGVSGLDSCAVSSMCWNVDGETNMGTCIGFCSGSENNAICDDPTTDCSIANQGTLILCLPKCDPLQQNCNEGEACYGIDDGYVCAPDASGEMGAHGDPCEFINACDPGLGCSDPSTHSNCPAGGCCSSFCDASEAANPCTVFDAAQECVRVFEVGQAPPGFEDTGMCAIPA